MRLLVAALLALAPLTACGDTADDTTDSASTAVTAPAEDNSNAGGDCDEAWQAAADVSDMQDTHEDLHPAFSACADFREWADASERHPGVLDGADPETYARNQCQYTPELAPTPVCTSLPS